MVMDTANGDSKVYSQAKLNDEYEERAKASCEAATETERQE